MYKRDRFFFLESTGQNEITPEATGPQCSLEYTAMAICEEDCDLTHLNKLSFSQSIEALCQGGTSDVVLYVACFSVSFYAVSLSVCLDDIYLGLGS